MVHLMAPADPVDLYCERVDASLWSEPLNAMSNASFIVAAFLVWWSARKMLLRGDREVRILIALLVAVGVGSALFHTVANVWSRWADVLPIAATLLWFLWLFLRRAARLSILGVAAGLGIFLSSSVAFGVLVPKEAVNGSNAYFSCFLALVAMGIFLERRTRAGARDFYLAAALFAVSLTCRSIDLAVCAAVPIGTHFLWHLLNGAAFWIASRGLLRSLAPTVGTPASATVTLRSRSEPRAPPL